jgi:hypothetical protein
MKRIRLKYLLVTFLLMLLCLKYNTAFSCDCIMYPVTSYIKSSDYVFLVKVEKIHKDEDPYITGYRATVIVTEVYKGGVEKGVKLEFDSIDNSDCTPRFKPDETYLLFAFKKNDKYYVYPCTYSQSVRGSGKNIQKIKKYFRRMSG